VVTALKVTDNFCQYAIPVSNLWKKGITEEFQIFINHEMKYHYLEDFMSL